MQTRQAKTPFHATPGKLVVCPTPLGNLGDMPPRAIEALRSADVVCCEDTRVTGKLLAALGIEGKRLERMDEATLRSVRHLGSLDDGASLSEQASAANDSLSEQASIVNASLSEQASIVNDSLSEWASTASVGLSEQTSTGNTSLDEKTSSTASDSVIARVLEGQTVVYCSDAGMPGVSDPGALLVAKARACGAPVEVLPGPTALTTAYVASGFACPRFYFGGFFPRKDGDRRRTLEALLALDAVVLFYESPHRIVAALRAIADMAPARQVAVCRELTKLHEEVCVGTAADIANDFAARSEIKGEIVLVIDVADACEADNETRAALEHASRFAAQLLAEGTLSKKDIVARLQKDCGISRNAAYEMVHGT